MSTRVTDKNLEAIAARINHMTNSPIEAYTRTLGKLRANIGNYHISHQYGGVCLHRMVNEAGGVSDVLMSGHVPKRELQTAMLAFIRGLEIREEVAA
jgi:hypothetical protein